MSTNRKYGRMKFDPDAKQPVNDWDQDKSFTLARVSVLSLQKQSQKLDAYDYINSFVPLNSKPDNLQKLLADGSVLCEFINTLVPGTIRKINKSKLVFLHANNINAYTAATRKISPNIPSFTPPDLIENKDFEKIIVHILSLRDYLAKYPKALDLLKKSKKSSRKTPRNRPASVQVSTTTTSLIKTPGSNKKSSLMPNIPPPVVLAHTTDDLSQDSSLMDMLGAPPPAESDGTKPPKESPRKQKTPRSKPATPRKPKPVRKGSPAQSPRVSSNQNKMDDAVIPAVVPDAAKPDPVTVSEPVSEPMSTPDLSPEPSPDPVTVPPPVTEEPEPLEHSDLLPPPPTEDSQPFHNQVVSESSNLPPPPSSQSLPPIPQTAPEEFDDIDSDEEDDYISDVLENQVASMATPSETLVAQDKKWLVKDQNLLKSIKEIYDTEQAYVHSLNQVKEFFVKPLASLCERREPLITFKQIDQIFSNIELLHGVNEQILSSLNPNETSASKLCQTYITSADELGHYKIYCSKYEDSLGRLETLIAENSKFAKWLPTQCKACGVQNLQSLLIKPVQRICKYPLLIRELVRNTRPTRTDELEVINKCLTIMQAVADAVNYKISKTIARSKLVEFNEKISDMDPPDFFTRALKSNPVKRLLLREGYITKYQPEGGRGQERYFVLFNDYLIWTRPSRLRKATFIYRSKCRVEDLSLPQAITTGDDALKANGFRLSDTAQKKTWELKCSNFAEKTQWMNDLTSAINKIKQGKLPNKSTSSRSSAVVTPTLSSSPLDDPLPPVNPTPSPALPGSSVRTSPSSKKVKSGWKRKMLEQLVETRKMLIAESEARAALEKYKVFFENELVQTRKLLEQERLARQTLEKKYEHLKSEVENLQSDDEDFVNY